MSVCKKSVTVGEIKALAKSIPAYIRYLLRLDVYESMAEMANDLGVSNGYVRGIKYRATNRRAN